jgi:hypothetical protein
VTPPQCHTREKVKEEGLIRDLSPTPRRKLFPHLNKASTAPIYVYVIDKLEIYGHQAIGSVYDDMPSGLKKVSNIAQSFTHFAFFIAANLNQDRNGRPGACTVLQE